MEKNKDSFNLFRTIGTECNVEILKTTTCIISLNNIHGQLKGQDSYLYMHKKYSESTWVEFSSCYLKDKLSRVKEKLKYARNFLYEKYY